MPLFKLDHAGIARILKSDAVAKAVDELAGEVAGHASSLVSDGADMPIEVDSYTTDRKAAHVTIASPAGLAEQAVHGTLTKAASAAGLEVKSKRGSS